MFKWIGILLLVASCVMIGNRQTAILRERVRIWEQSARLAGLLAARIRYTARPIPPLLKELYRTADLSALGFLPALANSPPEALAENWRREAVALTVLPSTERELLAAFGAPLGRTDVAGQTAHCQSYAKQFEERRAAATKELGEKGKLYPIMGVLAGLALALLLI